MSSQTKVTCDGCGKEDIDYTGNCEDWYLQLSMAGILLGVINVAIVVAALLLVGAIVLWFCGWIGFSVPDMVQKLYIGIAGASGSLYAREPITRLVLVWFDGRVGRL